MEKKKKDVSIQGPSIWISFSSQGIHKLPQGPCIDRVCVIPYLHNWLLCRQFQKQMLNQVLILQIASTKIKKKRVKRVTWFLHRLSWHSTCLPRKTSWSKTEPSQLWMKLWLDRSHISRLLRSGFHDFSLFRVVLPSFAHLIFSM